MLSEDVLARRYFFSYILERTRGSSSRHKLPDIEELRRTSGYRIFGVDVSEAAIKSLVHSELVIDDGGYLCTEKKEVM